MPVPPAASSIAPLFVWFTGWGANAPVEKEESTQQSGDSVHVYDACTAYQGNSYCEVELSCDDMHSPLYGVLLVRGFNLFIFLIHLIPSAHLDCSALAGQTRCGCMEY